ncbi:MAG: alpha-hydroxyketone-type quorum-sensing autoinducer synthase [Pseudomonadota bacterium]
MNNVVNLQPANRFPNAKEPAFLAHRVDRYYRERVQNTWDGKHLLRGRQPGEDAIRLMSNDYLSLADHPKILQAQAEKLLKEGSGMLMSAVFLNGDNPQYRFEQRLAHFMHAEQGILCQSGWCANTGLIQAIADEQTPVYIDMFAHMSLWEGARSAGATAIAFHHNDPDHLERQILKHGPGVIAVDSVYSTSGSVCPLTDIVKVGTAHGCVLVVDESHSLGTHGVHGEGLVASLGLADRVHFRTASLAKAFAGRAGFITCSNRFYDYFICESRPFIFSSAMLPHEIAALDETLTIIRQDGWRRDALHTNANYLRSHLDEMGYNTQSGQSQIIALESGSERQTMILRDALEARGIFGAVFFAPATPKNRSLMRFSVNSALTMAELERIVQVCYDIRTEVDLANWPSSRRKRNVAASISVHSHERQQAVTA